MTDDRITLREAFELYLWPDISILSPASIRGYRFTLNQWERLTDNPPIGDLTNRTLADFRAAYFSEGRSPATVNGALRCLRRVFRRLGPPDSGNPEGEGIISRVPYCKRLREQRRLPRVASHDELNRIYAACDSATWPVRNAITPSGFWRSFIVTLYNIGPRKNDLLSMTLGQVDFEQRTITYVAGKTGKLQTVPANQVTLAHVRSIWADRDRLFPVGSNHHALYRQWKAIRSVAGIESLTFHDLRRTCGTAFAGVAGAEAAATMLGHSASGVTMQFYINPTDSLRKAADELPQPEAFLSIFDRQPELADLIAPKKPRRADWQFQPRTATYRGHAFRVGPRPLAILQMLVTASRPVTADEILAAVWHQQTRSRTTVKTTLAGLRELLKRELRLPADSNPIPRSGDGWTIALPVAEAEL